MKPQIPQPLKVEHEELHAELVKATKAGGKTGEAAEEVARALHPHFEKEEEFALPPLGLLSSLIEGKVTSEPEKLIFMHRIYPFGGFALLNPPLHYFLPCLPLPIFTSRCL